MDNQVELAFVPTPGMGHILSTVQLAKLILQTNQRISISIFVINLPILSAKINAYVDAQTRDNLYPTRLTFITFPPLSNPPDPSSPIMFFTIIDLHKPILKQAIQDRVSSGLAKPAGFVLDMFCTVMVDIANELDIPSYIFFTSGSGLLNLIFYAQLLSDVKGVDVNTEFSKPGFEEVMPGFKNPVTSEVIPAVIQDKATWSGMFLNFARKFREMKGILTNTYVELEPFGVQALMNGDESGIPAVYPVGPILELDMENRGGGNDNKDKDSVIQWLDDQPRSSVVFLCFGSDGTFEEAQVKEIAKGLEKSGHRFLWTLRKPPQEGKPGIIENETFLEGLPEGFVDRTADRGKIIGWAPQVEVLAHPVVGGFVSHCGWNSTLESIWFGVPMATWPIYAEQQLNAFSLVKELELAVEIRMDYKRDMKINKGNFLVSADEIEKGVNELMSMDEKKRENVRKIGEEGKKALKEGGSSYTWLGRFIEDVLSNVS